MPNDFEKYFEQFKATLASDLQKNAAADIFLSVPDIEADSPLESDPEFYYENGYDPNCYCASCVNVKKQQEDSMATPTEEFAFVMYKPDAFERSLVGELMQMIEDKGPKLVASKVITMTPQQVSEHYNHHIGKDFWDDMIDFYTSGPTMACVYKGEHANNAIRTLIGNKHPSDSPPGSIRGRYATSFPKNLIHGSDTKQDAAHEMKTFFSTTEITEFKKIAKAI